MPLIRLGNSPLGGGSLSAAQLTVAVPPLRLGTTQLGTSGPKFRTTIQLGRYVLGGGGLTPTDPRDAFMYWDIGKTNVSFLGQVNGVDDYLTSQMGDERPRPKLGLTFTLGYQGVPRFTGSYENVSADGATDFEIDAIKITFGSGWFQFNLFPSLTGTTPSGAVNHIDIRTFADEYLDTRVHLSSPYLYYAPYNGRRRIMAADEIPQNRLVDPTDLPAWSIRSLGANDYVKIDNILYIFTSITGVSPFTGTGLTGTTPSGAVTIRNSTMLTGAYRKFTIIQLTNANYVAADITMDGETNVAINAVQYVSGNIPMDGETNVAILGSKSFAGFINMDGATDVAFTANRDHYSNVNMDGWTDMEITDSSYLEYGFQCDGATDIAIEGEYIAYGTLNMDGHTDMSIEHADLVITASTDMSIDARQAYTASLTMDGSTACVINAVKVHPGFLTMDGSAAFVIPNPKVTLNGYINIDGRTNVAFTPVQDAFGTVVFDQIDQDMTLIGSFVLEGSSSWTSDSDFDVDAELVEIPEYIWAVNGDNPGDTDFVQIVAGDFTAAAKKSIGGSGIIGRMNYKTSFGPDREMFSLYKRPTQDGLRQDWVRFPFYVDSQLDYPMIDETLGFNAAGKTAIAQGFALGREKEKYVTYSILTRSRVTQVTYEVLNAGESNGRVTQVATEILWIPPVAARVTQMVEEVLYLANIAVIQQAAIEALINADTKSVLQQAAIEMIHSIKSTVLATQTTLESLHTGNPLARVSQIVTEILHYNQLAVFAAAAIQQVAVERLAGGDPYTFLQQTAVETMHNGDAKARINADAVEMIHNNLRNARIQQTGVEALHGANTWDACIQQVAVEMLVRANFDGTVGALVNNPKFHT